MTNAQEKRTYCYCMSDGTEGLFMIECDGCKNWIHGKCVDPPMTKDDTKYLSKFYCKECEPVHGKSVFKPPTRKSTRDRTQINYNELNEGLAVEEHRFTKILNAREFAPDEFERMEGKDVTMEWARRTGMRRPILIEMPNGLDMAMPDNTLTVNDVANMCARDREIDAIEVATQSERIMTLDEWANYFHQPARKRKRILNVISLEISNTPLADQVRRPRLVRELDWIDNVWPQDLKAQNKYPRVQLYCLMSVQESYTDFHIDFGGSSVFYHLLSGEKVFYFIEPTKTNLKKYEKWSSSPDQYQRFLGDEIKGGAIEVHLHAGNTMFIPTGWIHAVYTPKDSVVIGGNFVHGLNMGGQLDIYEIEKRTLVPVKFRFPYFEKMQWYAAKKYLNILKDKPQILSNWELDGVEALVDFLQGMATAMTDVNNVKKEERKALRRTIPQGIKNVQKLLRKLTKYLRLAKSQRTVLRLKLGLPSRPSAVVECETAAAHVAVESFQPDTPPSVVVESEAGESAPEIKPEAQDILNGSVQQMEAMEAPIEHHVDSDDSDEWMSDLTEMEYLDSEAGEETDQDESDEEFMDENEDDAYLPESEQQTTKRKMSGSSDTEKPVKRGRMLLRIGSKGETSDETVPTAGARHNVAEGNVINEALRTVSTGPESKDGMNGRSASVASTSEPQKDINQKPDKAPVQKEKKKPATVYQRLQKTLGKLGRRK